MRRAASLVLALASALVAPGAALAAAPRERAIEQIPELMGRILESQEAIRERESALRPRIAGFEQQLGEARQRVQAAASESQATEALVDYVEAYAGRLDEQHAGLLGIQASVVRMRADARALARAAELAGAGGETPEERKGFYQEHFQGVASATRELAARLEREDDASTAGAVLHASWASHGALDLPLPELGPEGALAFAGQVEGLYARFQARSNQLRSERRAVRRLLDVLIERQLARRLDSLFQTGEGLGMASLLDGSGRSQDWQDLGELVGRTLGLPDGTGAPGESPREAAQLGHLDFFAEGGHRAGREELR